jgi:hypothetical protein
MVGGQFAAIQSYEGGPQGADYVCLHRPREDTSLIFLNVQKVYKPSRSGTIDTVPAPGNLVGWFEQHRAWRKSETSGRCRFVYHGSV